MNESACKTRAEQQNRHQESRVAQPCGTNAGYIIKLQ